VSYTATCFLLYQGVYVGLTGSAFKDVTAEPERVREVELHAMLGKKPLHVSSNFMSENLAAIGVKKDGIRRYSYRSLINPDLSQVNPS